MSQSILLHPECERELTEISVWYEETLQGLGVDFALAVRQGLSVIEKNPLLFPIVHKSFRRLLVKRFPYKLYYEISDKNIIIYALVHHKNDTVRKRKKLTNRKK